MNQIIMVIVGLALAIIATVTVGPSLANSAESAKASMVSQEVAAIRQAGTQWLVGSSTDGTFSAITTAGVAGQIPQLTLNADKLESKALAGVTYTVAPSADGKGFVITAAGLPTDAVEATVKTNLTKTPGTIDDAGGTNDGIVAVEYKV